VWKRSSPLSRRYIWWNSFVTFHTRRELQGKLLSSGNRAVLLEIPWAEHAFDAVFAGIGNRLALHYVEQFLAQVK
jgi:hypothetical protein